MAGHLRFCGCYFELANAIRCLPQVGSHFHSTILSASSSTQLTQTFTNPSKDSIKKAKYVFPLYDGVSVVSFTCRIGDRTIHGVVHEKAKAKAIFDKAVAQGQTAGLLQQSDEAADVFSTSLGNIPGGETIIVEVCYVGELKNDADTDGIRFTIPTSIAPRYGTATGVSLAEGAPAVDAKGISLTVDVHMPAESPIQSIQSPSHPIAVSMGTLSSVKDDAMSTNKASATLSLGEAALDKDFVLVVAAKDSGNPTAMLEAHPTTSNQRAVMATLVPKFLLPPSNPEIVFIADRSGSMSSNIPMLQSAMNVFLKSLLTGVKFNILSFGSTNQFKWPESRPYTKETLNQALAHVATFDANLGGTETLSAIRAAVQNRAKDFRDLDLILLTDGDIWAQKNAFEYVADQVQKSKGSIRLFPLGIGNGVSHSLIEGLARAGNGFAQAVQHGERLDKRVMRMLRGALSPHIYDYKLQVKYEAEDDFEMVDMPNSGTWNRKPVAEKADDVKKPVGEISLFNAQEDPEKEPIRATEEPLPDHTIPKILQGPSRIPSLFPFSRTTVYLLLSPDTIHSNPQSVTLHATSAAGPLRLEIPIQVLDRPGQTIHQLAARKVVQDLEEARGWIHDAEDERGLRMKDHCSRFDEVVQREAVRLGTTFQIANKWCSFVAVPANTKDEAIAAQNEKDKAREARGMEHYNPEQSMLALRGHKRPASGDIGSRPMRYSGMRNLVLKADARYPARAMPTREHAPASSGADPSAARCAAPWAAPPPSGFGSRGAASASASTASAATAFDEVAAGLSDDDIDLDLDAGSSTTLGAAGGATAPYAAMMTDVGSGARIQYCRMGPSMRLRELPVDAGRAAARGVRSLVKRTLSKRKGPDPGASARGSAPGASAWGSDPGASARGQYNRLARRNSDGDALEMSPQSRVHFFIAQQDFDGFWAESAGLWRVLGITKEEAQKARRGGGNAWTTMLVLSFLEEKMRDEKEVWGMVAEKARAWLDGQKLEDRAEIEAAAKKLLSG